MSLKYDQEYTGVFHSPGIEPWIMGFLKSKGSIGRVLDIGCGLGFTAFLLKMYLDKVEYLVGVDISAEKISRVKGLNLYDELYVADIRNFLFHSKFDTVVALEVLHELPYEILLSIENIVTEGGSVVISLPSLPQGASVEDLLRRGYNVYRYILRGLILIDLKNYEVLIAGSSISLKILRLTLTILKPVLRMMKAFRKGYLLVFKNMIHVSK